MQAGVCTDRGLSALHSPCLYLSSAAVPLQAAAVVKANSNSNAAQRQEHLPAAST